MNETEFLKKIHKRLAQITIGSSALRNQGAPKMVEITRRYLEHDINLKSFFSVIKSEKRFKIFLATHTEQLLDKYPENGKSWGAARKSLNLFFRELVYNKFLADYFELPTDFREFNDIVKYLEVPLDSDVAYGIIENADSDLKWKSIKSLTATLSDDFQTQANEIALAKGIARVHLDLIFWRPKSS